jgi:hypothetical protein
MTAELAFGTQWLEPRRVHRVMAVRSSIHADSKLTCAVGPYELVLFVCEIDGTRELDLTGRVSHQGAVSIPIPDLPVRLVDENGETLPTGTKTDEFGEFRLTARPGTRYGLRVGAGDDAPCVLVWDEGDW